MGVFFLRRMPVAWGPPFSEDTCYGGLGGENRFVVLGPALAPVRARYAALFIASSRMPRSHV
jgi:hypothetical protein